VNILAGTVAFASALLLTACGGGNTPDDAVAAPIQAALAESVGATVDVPSARIASAAETRTPRPLDGKWECSPDDDRSAALQLTIEGDVVQDRAGGTAMMLAPGKGIELGRQLVDYRDPASGQVIHARTMTLIDKPGFAAFFTRTANGGAGAGVEFSLNPNDTLKISDYSAMSGKDAVGQVVPMTCLRDAA
jgi:hypothetical protein